MEEENFYDYKARKEAFVSNLKGTTRWEVFAVGAVFPASFMLFRALLQAGLLQRHVSAGNRTALNVRFLQEFVFLVLIPLLSMTVLADSAIQVALACVGASVAVRMLSGAGHDASSVFAALNQKRLGFISVFRCGIMLYTCLAILAVDFPAFPRRFAKTETFGTSLMDLGVGAFVFSGGVVSRMARQGAGVVPRSARPARYMDECFGVLKSVLPMIVLGIARFATTKGVEYQEHTSEYGVHWNFFFTLAFMTLVSGLLRPFMHSPWSTGLFGVGVAALHEVALTRWGYEGVVMGTNRDTLLLQNKEGVCSLVGFVAIFFIASCVGSMMMRPVKASAGRAQETAFLQKWEQRAYNLAYGSMLLWLAIVLLGTTGGGAADNSFASSQPGGAVLSRPPSRRMANGGYILWVIAHSTCLLFGVLVVDFFFPVVGAQSGSVIIDKVNKNQLKVFLFSNICTGIVNVSIKTLDVPAPWAMAVLTVYMLVVGGAAVNFT